MTMRNRQTGTTAILAFLSERFDFSAANFDDLEFLATASDSSAYEAEAMREVVAGIGCLIDADLQTESARSGFLQHDDLPTLLWSIAGQIGVIGCMARIGSTAEYELRKRAEQVATEHGDVLFCQHAHEQSSRGKEDACTH